MGVVQRGRGEGAQTDFSETNTLRSPVHDNGAGLLQYFPRLKGMVTSVSLEMCPRKLTI